MIDVSVIIPVYNTEVYIEETIQSVADQEMKNYEIIIVDDGSTDKSIEIAERVLKDSGVRCIGCVKFVTSVPCLLPLRGNRTEQIASSWYNDGCAGGIKSRGKRVEEAAMPD